MDNLTTGQPGAVVLEDSVMQKGLPAAAGSRILENFVSPFDATVVARLRENEVPIAGRAAMDEFGIVRVSEDQPDDLSESVKAVVDGTVPFALCNDIFGKQRRQAAENGMCYIHPTYGTVSRFGLIPTASSMDQVGVVCANLSDGFRLLSVISGQDPGDGAMFPQQHYTFAREDKPIRIGIPGGILNKAEADAGEAIRELAGKFAQADLELEYFDVFKQVLYILSCAEISGNISRYDGVKFGYRTPGYKSLNELYLNTRTEGFGPDAKLAAVMGCMVLSQDLYEPYYERAMKIRRLIKASLRFDRYDIVALPTRIAGDSYENLSLFAAAPLAGLPAVSFSYRGQGVQLVANVKNENALLTAWEVLRS